MKVKGICSSCKKEQYMASKKFCIYCIQPKRTPLKPTKICKKYSENIPRRNKNAKRNNDYYRKMWDSHKVKACEECGIFLPGYSATYISHIIAKGANTFLRTEPENHNLLCGTCHNKWEFGNRKEMNIYPKNLLTIEKLKLKYYDSRAIK